MFGTYEAERADEPIHYGLVTPPDNRGWFRVIFHEYIAIWNDVFVKHRNLPLRLRLGYVFGPPGWSHDGSTKTSRQLQEGLADEDENRAGFGENAVFQP
jgi:hypothetical protein